MKTIVLASMLALVGCLKPIPPEPPKPVVIIILPPTKGEIVSVEILPDPEPPVHTWMTGDEIPKADAGPEGVDECGCLSGDPLCSCINGVKFEVTP
jgi:hypothetical protein